MLPPKTGVSLLQPFVFRIDPALYPSIASWFANHPTLFEEISQAARNPSASEILGPCRNVIEAYMDLDQSDRKDQGNHGFMEALHELCHYARFFREVKAQIGYAGRALDDRVRRDLGALLQEFGALIQPKAVLGRYACSFDEGHVSIEGLDAPFFSRSLSRFYTTGLKRHEDDEYATYEKEPAQYTPPVECLLFAATIGPGIDQEVSRLSDKGETYRALVLNGIGAGAADMVGVDLELFANQEEPREGTRWRRFHIGYGDFDLKEQRRLFGLLDPGRLGLTLSPSCIMIPEKSVSGFMARKRAMK